MTDTRLRDADPARAFDPDPRSATAQAMLARIVTTPRDEQPSRRTWKTSPSATRIAIGATLSAAAVTAALVVGIPWNHGVGTTAAAYAVTTGTDGAVHVSVHWNRLRDPAALQAALNRAGARVVVRIQTAGHDCPAASHVVGYSTNAVQWQSPGNANGGFTVHPADFPKDATFVLTVDMAPAGTSGLSTFAPSQPQMEGFGASMVVGPIPKCSP